MESLLSKVKEYFPNHRRSVVKNALILVLCLFEDKTVNLYQLRGHVSKFTGKKSNPHANYTRLIRFFNSVSKGNFWLDLLKFVFRSLQASSDYLILDGTSWERNGKKYHYLTLSILYKSVAIPIYWINLKKKGVSSVAERISFFERVQKLYYLKGKTLLMDREYIGEEWFKYLLNSDLNFIGRIRTNTYIDQINASKGWTYRQMTHKVSRSKVANKALKKEVILWGKPFTLVVSKFIDKRGKEEVAVFLTNLQDTPKSIVAQYRKRWKIECCFKHMKSNGFNLEQMNVEGKDKQNLMMAIIVFAYVIAVHQGFKTYHKVRLIKQKNGKIYKAISVFRNGLDHLIAIITSIDKILHYISKNIIPKENKYNCNKWLIV